MKLFVGDGYTRNLYIKEEPGLYPAVRINGRVAPYEAAHEVLLAVEAEPDRAKKRKLYADAIAERINRWDALDDERKDAEGRPLWSPIVADASGTKLEVTALNAMKLPYPLFNKLRDMMLGLAPSAPNPVDDTEITPNSKGDEKN